MTITLTGHRPIRRSSGRTTPTPVAPVVTAADTAPTVSREEPAVLSLGSSFDDTAWAASIGCRPLFAGR